MKEPKSGAIFEEGIEPTVTEEHASKFGERMASSFFSGGSHAGSLNPKPDRAYHVFAYSKDDHRAFVVREQLGIIVQVAHGLGEPRVAAWKRFVARHPIGP